MIPEIKPEPLLYFFINLTEDIMAFGRFMSCSFDLIYLAPRTEDNLVFELIMFFSSIERYLGLWMYNILLGRP